MKTNLHASLLVLSVSLLFSFPPTALAEVSYADYEGVYIKAQGALNTIFESDADGGGAISGVSGDLDFEPGFLTAGAIGYRFSKSFAFELEYTYRYSEIDKLKNISGLIPSDDGKFAAHVLGVNGFYYFDAWPHFKPYVGAGLGVVLDQEIELEKAGTVFADDLDDSGNIVFQHILGLEVAASPSLRVFTEVRLNAIPGIDYENSSGSVDFDYYGVSAGFGMSYEF